MCLVSSASAKGEFTLPDGSVVWLNKNSRLYYSDDLKGDERRVRLEGEDSSLTRKLLLTIRRG